jgi:hypothetical protein
MEYKTYTMRISSSIEIVGRVNKLEYDVRAVRTRQRLAENPG